MGKVSSKVHETRQHPADPKHSFTHCCLPGGATVGYFFMPSGQMKWLAGGMLYKTLSA